VRSVRFLKKIQIWNNLNNIPANIFYSASGMDTNMDKAMVASGVKRGSQ
jgi:hypothetical protein